MIDNSADVASTNGWDTAFAIRAVDVNNAIKKNKTSPTLFDVTAPDKSSSATGNFSDWQLGIDGSGNLMKFDIPVPSATVKVGGKEIVFNKLTAVAELRLRYVEDSKLNEYFDGSPPVVNAKKPETGANHHLVVQKEALSDTEPAVTVTDLRFGDPSKAPDDLAQGLLSMLLQVWLNANLIDFKHILATVNLGRKAAKGQFQFLMPAQTDYAFVKRTSLEDSIVGVLCITESSLADKSKLVQEISPFAIPGKERAGFLISEALLLNELVLPSLPTAFKGTTPQDFALNENKTAIELIRPGGVEMPDVPYKDQEYKSHLDSVVVRIVDDQMVMEVNTTTDISPGIQAHAKATSYCNIVLVDQVDASGKKTGKQTLSYKEARPADQEQWTTENGTIKVIKTLVEILAVIAAIAVTIVTDGAGATFLALVCVGLVGVAAEDAPDVVAQVNKDQAPAIDMLVLNSTAPIVWSDSEDFHLTSAQLNGSLQLGGDPNFAGGT